MKGLVLFAVVFLSVILAVFAAQRQQSLQPERVTNPVVLKRLDCQMQCQEKAKKDETLDQSECTFRCISPSCYSKTFSKVIDEEGKLGRVSARLAEKFQKCWEKEAAELQAAGIL